MSEMLLTREDLLKEEVNSYLIKLEPEKIDQFLLYFAKILQLGVEVGMFNEERRNFIANLIGNAIIRITSDDVFASSDVVIANYMYVVTLYTSSKSNWDALQELYKINSIDEAKIFLKNSKKWIIKKLSVQKDLLLSLKPDVLKIGVNNISKFYKDLKSIISRFINFDSKPNNFDLRAFHRSVPVVGYDFIIDPSKGTNNLLEELSSLVYCFKMEVSILTTIDTKHLMRKKREEAKVIIKLQDDAIDSINIFFSNELEKIRKEKAARINEYYESLHKRGRKKKNASDLITIEMDYNNRSDELEKKWKEAISQAEIKIKQKIEAQIELLSKEYSLIDLVKEFALFGFAKRGIIIYPMNHEKRGELLSNLETDIAICEFIRMNNNLNEEQIRYLISNI